MHDKYYYEAAELALIDTNVRRTFATGIAGFSHVIDSLSAIKYAKVKTIRDENGIVVDYEIEGDFPRYGNDDDRADDIAVWLLDTFIKKVKKHHTYRNAEPTTSILTITSNVVYGKKTGTLPDGRKAGEPLSPGANPAYGAEKNGLIASLNSVAKIPYTWSLDGISNTQTINPGAIGHTEDEQVKNLVSVMDGYFSQGAHHLNVNVFGTEKLIDAMEHPEKEEYANFTIRVSGYAVKFIDLTKEQQDDVIARTCQELMKYTDLIILDFKEWTYEKHKALTGKGNDNIKEMAQWLSDHGKKMWIRHVLVPGLTDGEEDLKAMAEFISTLKTVEKVEILPYHALGIPKWEKIGIDYQLKDAVAPTDEEVTKAEELLNVKAYS